MLHKRPNVSKFGRNIVLTQGQTMPNFGFKKILFWKGGTFKKSWGFFTIFQLIISHLSIKIEL